VQEINDIHENG